jgi:MFS family permease
VAAFASGPGQSYVFAIFLDPLLADTGLARTTVSALYALGTGVSAAAALVVSRLVDRFGPRVMLTVIAAGFGAACFGMSVASGALGVLLGFAALRALGQGSLPVTGNLLVAQWFVRMRGRALALVSLGFAASNALFPPLAQQLIATIGWRASYRVLGVAVWLLVIPAALLVVRNRPEAVGLLPDGLPPEEGAPAQTPGRTETGRAIWRTTPFWLLALPLTAGPFVITALVFHQASIFVEHGLAREVAAGVFTAFAIAAATASTLGGFAIDRFGPRPVLFASLGLLCGGTLGLAWIDSPLTAALYASVMGCAGGAQAVVGGAIWAHYYGRDRLGSIQGAAAMVGITASALAPLPLAALQQATGSYQTGIFVFAALPLLCAALLSRFRPPASAA